MTKSVTEKTQFNYQQQIEIAKNNRNKLNQNKKNGIINLNFININVINILK